MILTNESIRNRGAREASGLADKVCCCCTELTEGVCAAHKTLHKYVTET